MHLQFSAIPVTVVDENLLGLGFVFLRHFFHVSQADSM